VKPRVRVRACTKEGVVRVEIEDNGIGIEPEYRTASSASSSGSIRSRCIPGTGIGLAIVRKAMERMGGRSGVESEPGRGSRFWIEIPMPAEDAPPAPAA
jgi:signal transduction histidine kinase